MGCTYSEEPNVAGMRTVVGVPVLANSDDVAIVGAPIPIDTPLETLCGELCIEMYPVTWYGAHAQRSYSCHTSIQGVSMGHLDLCSERSSSIIFPIAAKTFDSMAIFLHFHDAMHTRVGSICINIPAYNVDRGEVKLNHAFDIIPTSMRCASPEPPSLAVTSDAHHKRSNSGCPPLGRVALEVTLLPHVSGERSERCCSPGRQRLSLQFLESSDNLCDLPLSTNTESFYRPAGSLPTSPERPEARRIPLKTMMAGIRQSVNVCVNPQQKLTPVDFSRESTLKFNLDNGAVEMKLFAPQAFSSIRALDGISPAQYQQEWNLPEDKLVLDIGAGRSGSLFLRSNTNRFILKTIPHAEVCTFLCLLESYYKHLLDYPDSFIMHVHGLYRFWWSGSWMYIILFTNILYSENPSPVHIFDLKGRVAKPGKLMARRNEKGIVWKDKDLERFFFLPQETNDRYRRQLAADVAFLESHNMMDYSLLVGVRQMPDDYVEKESNRNRNFFRSWMGGTPGTSACQEVYYIGIIDCLTQYNSKKKVANFCKQMLWKFDTLSTVPSKDYSIRFLNFMYAIFPTEQEVASTALKHPNLALPIAALDTLNLNPNQVASPLLDSKKLSTSDLNMHDSNHPVSPMSGAPT